MGQVQQYLQRKLAASQSSVPQGRKTCYQCFRAGDACFCRFSRPFATRTHFCLLMHPREARKEKVGTGRMTHLHLPNSTIIVGEQFGDNDQVNQLIASTSFHCMVLYPGEKSHNITQAPLPALPDQKELLLFVIDGTWACAKSMMRDSHNLHRLPKLSFDSDRVSRFHIKHQPASYCLSTIESIYYVLHDMQRWGHEAFPTGEHHALLDGLERLVDFQITCAQDPNRSHYRSGQYRAPEERRMSKKWQSRRICFDPKNYHHS